MVSNAAAICGEICRAFGSVRDADAVFIATGHDVYKDSLTAGKLEQLGVRYVFDGRNALDKHELAASELAYSGIGK